MEIRCEDSFDGLLSAIAYCLRANIEPMTINGRDRQISLHPETFVTRENGIGLRFRKFLAGISGDKTAVSVLETCWQAFLSEQEDINMSIYRYLRLAMKSRTDPACRLQIPDVNRVVAAAQAAGTESHRYLGLLRFHRLPSGLYQADFRPDNNILPLILPHFADRFQDQEFVIRDCRRYLAALHLPDGRWTIFRISPDGGSYADDPANPGGRTLRVAAPADNNRVSVLDQDDDSDYSRLWHRYLQHLTIPERQNRKLQKSNLPLKCRQFLPEFADWSKKGSPADG